MAKAKRIIKAGVVHLMRDGVRHTLRAGDEVPDWADVTNPAIVGDKPTQASTDTTNTTPPVKPADTASTSTESTPAAKLPGIKELRAKAKELDLSAAGSKEEIAARIAAKLAEAAPADDDAASDDEDGDRPALEARAKARGIEFDENTTDDELAAFLEDQE